MWVCTEAGMDDAERRKKLNTLYERELYWKSRMQMLDYPKTVSDYLWWGATWWSASRGFWRRMAKKAFAEIEAERSRLKAEQGDV